MAASSEISLAISFPFDIRWVTLLFASQPIAMLDICTALLDDGYRFPCVVPIMIRPCLPLVSLLLSTTLQCTGGAADVPAQTQKNHRHKIHRTQHCSHQFGRLPMLTLWEKYARLKHRGWFGTNYSLLLMIHHRLKLWEQDTEREVSDRGSPLMPLVSLGL